MLSERAKNWLAGPKALIAVAAIVGLVGWGGIGLVLGGLVGIVASILVAAIIRHVSGGMMPRRVRQELVQSALQTCPDVVEKVYPNLAENERQTALEEHAEAVAERAVELSPSNEEVWSRGVVLGAVRTLAAEQDTEAEKNLYQCLELVLARDWYS